jgi:hypothetical protein
MELSIFIAGCSENGGRFMFRCVGHRYGMQLLLCSVLLLIIEVRKRRRFLSKVIMMDVDNGGAGLRISSASAWIKPM